MLTVSSTPLRSNDDDDVRFEVYRSESKLRHIRVEREKKVSMMCNKEN